MPRALTHLADHTYRLLLGALPSDVRRDFGDDMVQMFRDHRRHAVGRPWALVALWIAAAYDVLAEAIASRRAHDPARPLEWRSAMRAVGTDVRHGLRLIRRYPASAAIAILTLALGIGANAAIFSVVDAVLLRSLPYPEPDRLVMVWEKRIKENVLTNPVSPADFLDWRKQNDVFENMAALADTSTSVTGDGEPVVVEAGAVSWAFFDVLGIRPALGRTFQPGDEIAGHDRVMLLTDGFWKRRYGGDPNIVGRKINLNGNPWEVIGVLPESFHFSNTVQIYATLVLERPGVAPPRASHQLEVYARITRGVTFAQASDSMDRLGAKLAQEYPQENANHSAYVSPLRDEFVGPVRTSLVALFAAVGVVLLIACVNVASLLLARAASRQREMAVRSALGASRSRLVSQTLVESIVLSVVGAIAGVALAELLISALPVVLPAQLSVVGIDEIALNWRVLLFAAALAVLTGLIFGLLPAWHASAPEVARSLSHGGRSAAGVRRGARLGLVIGEVALAALALVSAGLILRSFAATIAQPLGFDPDGRVAFTISIPAARYKTPDARRQALTDIRGSPPRDPRRDERRRDQPLPLDGGDSRSGIAIEGREPRPDEPPSRMHPRAVTPGYFQTMGIRVVRGRGFTPADAASSEAVAVINESAVRRFFGDANPIGRRFQFVGDQTWIAIVGVAADVRHWGLRKDVNPMVYLPQLQLNSQFLTFVVRSDGDRGAITNAARVAVNGFDANLPLARARTMDDIVAASVRSERAQTILMGTFGVTALALAMIGIYGVMAQLVSARRQEIGVRMALGARPATILRQLLTEGFWQTAVGLVIGLAAGTALMRLATTLLYNVTPTDPLTLGGVAVVLIGAAMLACVIPGRRAMRTDPVQALRSQ